MRAESWPSWCLHPEGAACHAWPAIQPSEDLWAENRAGRSGLDLAWTRGNEQGGEMGKVVRVSRRQARRRHRKKNRQTEVSLPAEICHRLQYHHLRIKESSLTRNQTLSSTRNSLRLSSLAEDLEETHRSAAGVHPHPVRQPRGRGCLGGDHGGEQGRQRCPLLLSHAALVHPTCKRLC